MHFNGILDDPSCWDGNSVSFLFRLMSKKYGPAGAGFAKASLARVGRGRWNSNSF